MLSIYEIPWCGIQQLETFEAVNIYFLPKRIKRTRLQFIWEWVVTNFNVGNLEKSLMAFNSLGCFLHFLPLNHRVSLSDSPQKWLSRSICVVFIPPFPNLLYRVDFPSIRFSRTKAMSIRNLKGCSGLTDYKSLYCIMNSLRVALTLRVTALHLYHFVSLHVTMT